jgi:uncharacterized protein (DUF302 family)
MPSFLSRILAAGALACGFVLSASAQAGDMLAAEGVVTVRSVYQIDETIERLKKDVAAKGIVFFQEIDQAELAAGAGVKLPRSTLLVFGNPPLGTLFLTSNPLSGLDWPVRLLVFEDTLGQVWTAYTDFSWIAHRYGIKDRDTQFATASGVIASITSSVAQRSPN